MACLLAALPCRLMAQSAPPFWKEILAFKAADAQVTPIAKPIVFVGSSSFRKWVDVNAYFPGYPIINRGFGGSTLQDVIRYAYDVILPYKPKQVVVYCGENDLAANVTPAEVVMQFRTLFVMIRENLPHTTIDFVSIKKSPSREKFFPQVDEVNKAILAFLQQQHNAAYIDINPIMLDASGQPRPELFLSDHLHMQPEGYALWKKVIGPYLLK
ncbi:Lysophospholipase L1 [Chitinophaga costaii]|uniref:Lysophospholipase L1 n=2 Tax=Chitinophaga costaii TaxID=1335309 RepID=A0A1C4FDV0_9BACT|nr:Lysophospholipase L1 [Chitinophaga costaii]